MEKKTVKEGCAQDHLEFIPEEKRIQGNWRKPLENDVCMCLWMLEEMTVVQTHGWNIVGGRDSAPEHREWRMN